MASPINVPISQLGAALSVISTDFVPVVHGGQTLSATVQGIHDATERRGVLQAIAADGSVNNGVFLITFSPAFPSSVGVATLTVANYNGSDNDVIFARIKGTPAINQMQVIVNGGTSGKTLDLHWRVTGS